MDEFALIAELLAPLSEAAPGAFNLTDDAALVSLPEGRRLVIAKDMLVAGVHCLADDDPGLIARKLLRVNLSDLAAMGAAPHSYLLGLALPPATDDGWLRGFVGGLALDQASFGVRLIGGDTVSTDGPFTASLTALGEVRVGAELRRSAARPGDLVFVSGSIGDAALGLAVLNGGLPGLDESSEAWLRDRYHLPQPRIALGLRLSGLVHGLIDVSDGLMADLGHICAASGVAAEIDAARIPVSTAARAALALDAGLREKILGGGDDYELLFTAVSEAAAPLAAIARDLELPITAIGRIVEGGGMTALDETGAPIDLASPGWRHF